MLMGNDVEADSASKTNIRQMFDGDLLVHQDLLVRLVSVDSLSSTLLNRVGREILRRVRFRLFADSTGSRARLHLSHPRYRLFTVGTTCRNVGKAW